MTDIEIFHTKMIDLDNQLIVLPNGKLANDKVKNWSRMGKSRIVHEFGISYDNDI